MLRTFSLLLCGFWAACCVAWAQPGATTLLDARIHSLQMYVNDDAGSMPVLELGSSDVLHVSFDDLAPHYERYTYRITHCDPEGNPSDELLEADYVERVAEDETIDDCEPSRNTTITYMHYALQLPNARVRPLLSGNYRLTVYRENEHGEQEEVIRTNFAVVERKMSLSATCTTNTDVDWNESHQQLALKLATGDLYVRDPATDIRLCALQNRRWDNAKVAVPPTAVYGNTLEWSHCRGLLFTAGNEYRKMEMLSTRYPGMHGESMRWKDTCYVYKLMDDQPRRNYLYDEDRNGQCVVRYDATGTPETEADYVLTRFTLQMPEVEGRALYVAGRWAEPALTDRYRMHYNHEAGQYEADIMLKTGYYNYMYLSTPADGDDAGSTQPVEGDYFQTENEYALLVYYRAPGGRYWQLVACINPSYRPR